MKRSDIEVKLDKVPMLVTEIYSRGPLPVCFGILLKLKKKSKEIQQHGGKRGGLKTGRCSELGAIPPPIPPQG